MPGNLLRSAQQIAAEIVLRARTGEGAAEAAGDFRRVATAAGETMAVVDRTSQVFRSAESGYNRTVRALDPLAVATRRQQQQQEALNRALEAGVIDRARYNELVERSGAALDRTRDRIERAERAQRGLRDETDRYGGSLDRVRGLLIAAFSIEGVRRFAGAVQSAVGDVAQLADAARNIGGVGEAGFLQEARFALGQQGFDQAGADTLIRTFSRNVGNLRLNTGPLDAVLERFEQGDALRAQIAGAEDLRGAYEAVLGALNEIDDAQVRAAVAVAAFGKNAGVNFGSAAQEGVEGFRLLAAEAREAGLVIGDDVIARADELDDRFNLAASTIRTQFRSALVELGPLLTALLEGLARFFRGLNEARSRIGANLGDIGRTNEIAALERQRAEAQRQVDAFARARAANDGPVVDLFGAESRAERRVEEATALINQLIATTRVSGADLIATLGGATTAAADFGAVVSEDAAETERALKRAAAEAARLRVAFEAGEAASNQRTDDLRLLVEAAAQGSEALAAARQRVEIEREIARLRTDAARAGVEFDEAAARARETEQRALETALAAQTERNQNAERLAAQYRDQFNQVADDFITRLARGDPDAFRNLGRQLRDILFDTVLDPFRAAFADLLRNLFSGGGLGGGGGSLGRLLEPVDQFLRQRGINAGVLGQAAGAGFAGFSLGQGFSDLLGFDRGGAGRRGLTGAATGAAIGSVIPGLGTAVGAIVGGLVGVFSSLLGNPSNRFARGALDPNSGVISGQRQRDNSDQANANASARDQLLSALGEGLSRIAEVTGARFAETVSLEINSRNGILLGFNGFDSGGGPANRQTFDDPAAAIAFAVERLVGGLEGGNEALVAAAREFSAVGEPIDRILDRLGNLAGVLEDPDRIVDPLKAQIDAIVEAFEGLDVSAGALKTAFDGAIDALAARVDDDNRRALQQDDNPALAAINEILEAQAARRNEIERLAGQGGNVDTTLLADVQRRQLLNQFNITDRFAQATDAARFAIDELIRNQSNEQAAFRRAIEGSGGLLTEADFLGLLRAQEAERFNAFQGLSDEDKARLSGRAGDFEDLTRQYQLTVERLIAAGRELSQSYEDQRAALEQTISARGGEVDTLQRSIDALDTRRGLATPGETIARLRAQLEDLDRRSTTGTEEDRARARAALPEAADAFLNRLEQVFGSSAPFAAGADFARDILVRARDAAASERTIAERQLTELEATRATIERIEDLLAAPRLDIAALAAATSGLSADNPVSVLALALADLEARQTAQTDRLIAALEALTPADVGLSAPAPATLGSSTTASTLFASAAPTPASAGAPGSNAPSVPDDAIVDGLIAVADEIATQTSTIIDLETKRRSRDERIENYLKLMATQRGVAIGQ